MTSDAPMPSLWNVRGWQIAKYVPLALLPMGVLTRFAFFGHPASVVFDEVYFGPYSLAYFSHNYIFDVAPPLGKLIYAGWAYLWGYHSAITFTKIGAPYVDNFYLVLRFLPTLLGALLPLIVYGIARELKMTRTAAILSGTLVAFDNALITETRFILIDPFLLFFGFAGLWAYLVWSRKQDICILFVAGALGAAAFSIKWTGLTFIALMIILECASLFVDRSWLQSRRAAFSAIAPRIGALLVLPLIIYVSQFAIHFSLLSKTGGGDAFMSPAFQHGLSGNTYANDPTLTTPSFVEKFFELNREMYLANLTMPAGDPYASPWYTWPLMKRPIYYWVNEAGDARIYFFGNPVVWWGSTLAVLLALAILLWKGAAHSSKELSILLGAWMFNMLPFIGISRIMFIYSYFPALIFAILILAYLVDQIRSKRRVAILIAVSAIAMFLFFAPLTYGTPLSDQAYRMHVWFSSWE